VVLLRRVFFQILLFAALSGSVLAGTVGGMLSSNTVWDSSESPYVLTGHVVVASNALLEIHPGTEVRLPADSAIVVYGTLDAMGDTNDPIVFTNHIPGTNGYGIAFLGTGTNGMLSTTGIFEHCSFYSLRAPVYETVEYPGAVYGIGARLSVSNCTFEETLIQAVQVVDSRVIVSGSRMRDVHEAVRLVRSSAMIVSNRISELPVEYDAIDVNFSWTGPGDDQVVIEGNEIWDGGDDGIDLGTSPAIVRRNIVRSFADKGISLGEGSHATLEHNLIVGCGQGISVRDYSNPVMLNNTVVGCSSGVYSKDYGRGSLSNSIVWDCSTSIRVASGSKLNVGYSLIGGTGVWTGEANINADPELTPTFRLRNTSPCIDAGVNLDAGHLDLDGELFWDHPEHSNVVSAVDIGADEFVDEDGDAVADYWERLQCGSTNMDAVSDDDSDNLNLLGEYEHSTDPDNADSDNDQLPDGWEVSYSLDPLSGDDAELDPDSDDMSSWEEFVADTDPNSPTSLLQISAMSIEEEGVRLTWQGGVWARQLLQTRTALTGMTEVWSTILTNEPPTAVVSSRVDKAFTPSTRYYRILIDPQ
jgi:parallel beta-helix repeat protein